MTTQRVGRTLRGPFRGGCPVDPQTRDCDVLYVQVNTRCNVRVKPVCSLCGRIADPEQDGDPPLSWSADIVETSEGNRTRWVCTECTRRFVRSIEAKLDQVWW